MAQAEQRAETLTNPSDEQIQLVNRMLTESVVAISGVHQAKLHYERVSEIASAARLAEQSAESLLNTANIHEAQSNFEVWSALKDVSGPERGISKNLLDSWFDYRRAVHNNTRKDADEYWSQVKQDEDDRAALERLTPGVKIMHLHPQSNVKGLADTVVTSPWLAVRHDAEGVSLDVVFETVKSQAPTERDIYDFTRSRYGQNAVHSNLEELAKYLVVGDDDIHGFFEAYEPPIIDANEERIRLRDVAAPIDYIDALAELGLTDANAEAVKRMKASLATNTATVLGIQKNGNLEGVYEELLARNLLKGLKRLDPKAYNKLYDKVGVGLAAGTYRLPDRYTNLFAVVENDVSSDHDLTIEQKAAVAVTMKARGADKLERRSRK